MFNQSKEEPETESEALARQAAFEYVEKKHPTCRFCDGEPTKREPKVVRAWIDKLPIFSWINRLYALPWRYTVHTPWPWNAEDILCQEHHDHGREHLEHFIADQRNGHAQFNAMQLEKVNAMNRGGLSKFLKDSEDSIQKKYAEPQLTDGRDET